MLIISILITVPFALIIHELGHLVAARSCNVPSSELGLGLGPKLFRFSTGQHQVQPSRASARILRASRRHGFKRESYQAATVRLTLAGVLFNLIAGLATYGTVFSWWICRSAAGNLLPLYQHDWLEMRSGLNACFVATEKPTMVEWAFTFSGGFA